MNTKLTLILTLLLPLAAFANSSEPTSALEFQQITNTRIVVEENHLRFFTGGSERLTIDQDGNVGIGITSPTTKLSVVDNTGYNFGFSLVNTHDAGHGLLLQGGGTTGSRFILQMKDAAGNDRVTVADTGEVGIGTTAPESPLHIYSDIQNTDLQLSNGYGTNGRNRIILAITDRTWQLENDGPKNIFKIRDSSAGEDRFCIDYSGKVGIGTNSPSYKLQVAGIVRALKFKADGNTWADFVFDEDYQLSELDKVEKFIEKNHHLPEIPSAAEVQENGIDIVDMQAKLLQKIEELTLYVIEQNKKIERLQMESSEMKSFYTHHKKTKI